MKKRSTLFIASSGARLPLASDVVLSRSVGLRATLCCIGFGWLFSHGPYIGVNDPPEIRKKYKICFCKRDYGKKNKETDVLYE